MRKEILSKVFIILMAFVTLVMSNHISYASPDSKTLNYVLCRKDIPHQTTTITTSPVSPDGEEGLYTQENNLYLTTTPWGAVIPVIESSSQFSDKDFKPQELTYTKVESVVKGYVDPDTGDVRLESPSFPTVTIKPPDKEWYFLEHFVTKILSQDFEYDKIYEFVAWDNEFLDFTNVKLTFLEERTYKHMEEERPIYRIRIVRGRQEQEAYIDDSSVLFYIEDEKNSTYQVLLVSDEFPDIEPYNYAYFIPANIAIITQPEDAISSQILLTFERTTHLPYAFIDNRQQLHAQGEDFVVLNIRKEFAPQSSGLSLLDEPWSGLEGYEEYIAPTKYVECQDPQITALAQEIVGDEKDTWKAINLLLDYTYNFIEPSAFPTILRASALLTTKKGNSLSHPIFFASLARSLSIPTKLVFGVRYANEEFMPLVWNEVWVGKWHAVDPHFNEPAPGGLQIKLFEDACIENILNYSALNEMGILIVATILIDPELGTSSMTGYIDCFDGEYLDKDLKFKIVASPDEWNMTRVLPILGQERVVLTKVHGSNQAINIVCAPVDNELTPEEALSVVASQFKSSIPEDCIVTELASGTLPLENKANAFATFGLSFSSDDLDSISYVIQLVLISDQNKIFTVNYMLPSHIYEAGTHDFLQILQDMETHVEL